MDKMSAQKSDFMNFIDFTDASLKLKRRKKEGHSNGARVMSAKCDTERYE